MCRRFLWVCVCGVAIRGFTAVAETRLADDPDIQLAQRLENAFRKVAARVQPSVVNLTVHTGSADWREEIWRAQEGGMLPRENRFTGSGVLLDSAGTILTNEHVVRHAEAIRVALYDGKVYRARVAGSDPRSDLAVLVPTQPLKFEVVAASLADSSTVAVGQWALAVGNPFELSNSLTVGVVSAHGRSLPLRSIYPGAYYTNLIQTDAAINRGNSGGPLFNLNGEVIGINTMIFSRSGLAEGVGFAIPINDIKPRLAALKAGQPVQYGWLGVRLKSLEPDQEAFTESQPGVLVIEVLPDMPADRAGLQQGSRIVRYDGQDVSRSEDLIALIGRTEVGRMVKLDYYDPAGNLRETRVRIGLSPQDLARLSRFRPGEWADEPPAEGEFPWRGMHLRELPPAEASKLGATLRVSRVKKGSPADRAGFYEGALLDRFKSSEQSGFVKLESLEQFRRLAESSRTAVYLHSPLLGFVQVSAE